MLGSELNLFLTFVVLSVFASFLTVLYPYKVEFDLFFNFSPEAFETVLNMYFSHGLRFCATGFYSKSIWLIAPGLKMSRGILKEDRIKYRTDS